MKRVHLLIVAIVLIAAGIAYLVVTNLPAPRTGQDSDRSDTDNQQVKKQDKGDATVGPSKTSQTIAQQVSDLEIKRDIELLGKGQHDKRLEAIRRLGKRKAKEAVPVLIELIDASYVNDEEREATLYAVAWALGDIGDLESIPALNKLCNVTPKVMTTIIPCEAEVEVIKYNIPLVAQRGITCINRLEKEEELDKLLLSLPEKDRMDKVARLACRIDKENESLCYVAFNYLKKQPDGPDAILPYLEKIPKDPIFTAELLRYLVEGSQDEKAAQALIRLADSPDGKSILTSISVMGGIKSETAIEPLKNLAQKYPDYEWGVVGLLGKYRREDLIPYFIERLVSEESGWAAAAALGKIGKAVIPHLRDAFTRASNNEKTQHHILAALSPKVRGVEILPIIDLALDSPFEKVQRDALMILDICIFKIEDAAPRLMKGMNSPSADVRLWAVKSLEIRGGKGDKNKVCSLLEQALLSPFDDVRKWAKESLEELRSLEETPKK